MVFSTADTSHGDDVTECKSPKTVNVYSVRIKVERGALGGAKERRFVEFISEWILCFGHNLWSFKVVLVLAYWQPFEFQAAVF